MRRALAWLPQLFCIQVEFSSPTICLAISKTHMVSLSSPVTYDQVNVWSAIVYYLFPFQIPLLFYFACILWIIPSSNHYLAPSSFPWPDALGPSSQDLAVSEAIWQNSANNSQKSLCCPHPSVMLGDHNPFYGFIITAVNTSLRASAIQML